MAASACCPRALRFITSVRLTFITRLPRLKCSANSAVQLSALLSKRPALRLSRLPKFRTKRSLRFRRCTLTHGSLHSQSAAAPYFGAIPAGPREGGVCDRALARSWDSQGSCRLRRKSSAIRGDYLPESRERRDAKFGSAPLASHSPCSLCSSSRWSVVRDRCPFPSGQGDLPATRRGVVPVGEAGGDSPPMRILILSLIRFYQWGVSPLIHFLAGPGSGCRFTPSCSEYFREAVLMHGTLRGVRLGFCRILKCQPLGPSGYDPVPPITKS